MLFNTTFSSTEIETPSQTFVFDYNFEQYEMSEGSPVLVTGAEAVKQFLLQMLHTAKGRYAVYPASFGTSIKDVVGHKYPRGYALPELRREIEESCSMCPEIDSISDFTVDGNLITFRVNLKRGLQDDTTFNGNVGSIDVSFDISQEQLNALFREVLT